MSTPNSSIFSSSFLKKLPQRIGLQPFPKIRLSSDIYEQVRILDALSQKKEITLSSQDLSQGITFGARYAAALSGKAPKQVEETIIVDGKGKVLRCDGDDCYESYESRLSSSSSLFSDQANPMSDYYLEQTFGVNQETKRIGQMAEPFARMVVADVSNLDVEKLDLPNLQNISTLPEFNMVMKKMVDIAYQKNPKIAERILDIDRMSDRKKFEKAVKERAIYLLGTEINFRTLFRRTAPSSDDSLFTSPAHDVPPPLSVSTTPVSLYPQIPQPSTRPVAEIPQQFVSPSLTGADDGISDALSARREESSTLPLMQTPSSPSILSPPPMKTEPSSPTTASDNEEGENAFD